MKDFMFIFRNKTDRPQPTAEEMQNIMQLWMGWIDKLKQKNVYTAGEPLTHSGKVVKGNEATVIDGPFAESKEIVGGYFLIKANSFEEAAELAKDCPDLSHGGSVEVREIMKM
jgi:hypothetical protein